MLERVELYQQAAEQGHADAQNKLGHCYQNGIGIEKDVKKAVELYQKAAEQGNADAQNALGVCYQDGIEVEKDTKKAVELYRFYRIFIDNYRELLKLFFDS